MVESSLRAALFSKLTTVHPSCLPGMHLDQPLDRLLVYYDFALQELPHIYISTILDPRSGFNLRFVVHTTAYSSLTVLTV
jgi:hypothetical protein